MGQAPTCETCRFWDEAREECRRHSPVLLVLIPPRGELRAEGNGKPAGHVPVGQWPHTVATDWCGEWQPAGAAAPAPPAPAPVLAIGDLAARRFVRRLAPALRTTDPAGVLTPLLGQLPPDIRQVVVRLHGLDGKVADDVKRVAAETGLTPQRVRGLRSAGEYLLRDAFALLTDRQLAADTNGAGPHG
ncbi:MAG: hypothetical protein JWO38_4734 [Gemmataceae bacterium]|nr:hypothetical protein [Gemmataceae bacterium]